MLWCAHKLVRIFTLFLTHVINEKRMVANLKWIKKLIINSTCTIESVFLPWLQVEIYTCMLVCNKYFLLWPAADDVTDWTEICTEMAFGLGWSNVWWFREPFSSRTLWFREPFSPETCDGCMNRVVVAWIVWWLYEPCDGCMNRFTTNILNCCLHCYTKQLFAPVDCLFPEGRCGCSCNLQRQKMSKDISFWTHHYVIDIWLQFIRFRWEL